MKTRVSHSPYNGNIDIKITLELHDQLGLRDSLKDAICKAIDEETRKVTAQLQAEIIKQLQEREVIRR